MSKHVQQEPLINYLKKQNIVNPIRTRQLISEAVNNFQLDLHGLTVLTEAATGNYVVTPIIAALAKAKKVFAVTKDSVYGKAIDVKELTEKFAEFCDVDSRIEVLFERQSAAIKKSDIVTNLGFVRPINKDFIAHMKVTTVVPLMCEAWEFRKGDVDLESCYKKGISVMGTNEDHPALETFKYCGYLCLKMLFELQIEVYKSKIVILSNDKFGNTIEKTLRANGSTTFLVKELRTDTNRQYLKSADAVVVADYTSSDIFIGNNGHISTRELFELSPAICVIHFAGKIDIKELQKFGIPCFPNSTIGSYKMSMTLADLGPKPIIELHCAGLKIGEMMVKSKLKGMNNTEIERIVTSLALGQVIDFKTKNKGE